MGSFESRSTSPPCLINMHLSFGPCLINLHLSFVPCLTSHLCSIPYLFRVSSSDRVSPIFLAVPPWRVLPRGALPFFDGGGVRELSLKSGTLTPAMVDPEAIYFSVRGEGKDS